MVKLSFSGFDAASAATIFETKLWKEFEHLNISTKIKKIWQLGGQDSNLTSNKLFKNFRKQNLLTNSVLKLKLISP